MIKVWTHTKKISKNIVLFALVSVVFVALIIIGNAIYYSLDTDSESVGYDTPSCNVFGINVHGDIFTYIPGELEDERMDIKDAVASENIVSVIRRAEENDNIKAIILDVDSAGGYPVAGEEIANALEEVMKPTVAVIRQNGLSAAYWAVTGVDTIFASKNSDIGSIGVTFSYLENIAKNQKDGLKYVQLSTGKFKDAGNPNKPITEEERKLFIRDLRIVHDNFIGAISNNRGIPIEEVRAIADGSSVLGEKAKELGLIDEIGGRTEAEEYLETRIKEKPEICWY